MPRNGSGVASIVNTFTPLTTANATDVNANFTDVASMITDSLARDGQAGMTGPFLAISGTVDQPGISFNADPDTGFRRPSGNTMAAVCGGADVATYSSTGVSVSVAPTTGDNLTNKTYVDARGALTGEIKIWSTNTAPTGYLECSGAAVSRTTYAALFAVIGTAYGTGDGSTTFNLPNLRGEFIRGWDNGRGVDTGRTFGSAQADELETHTHAASASGSTSHLHSVRGVNPGGSGSTGVVSGSFTGFTDAVAANTVPLPTITVDATGGAETRPRNVALMYIIKI